MWQFLCDLRCWLLMYTLGPVCLPGMPPEAGRPTVPPLLPLLLLLLLLLLLFLLLLLLLPRLLLLLHSSSSSRAKPTGRWPAKTSTTTRVLLLLQSNDLSASGQLDLFLPEQRGFLSQVKSYFSQFRLRSHQIRGAVFDCDGKVVYCRELQTAPWC